MTHISYLQEICTLTLKRTDHIEGGLVQAHITGDNGTIKLDGIRRQDETCTLHLLVMILMCYEIHCRSVLLSPAHRYIIWYTSECGSF